jgi:hypothetical protein
MQRGHRRPCQVDAGRPEQGLRLGEGEPQVVRADLGQLPVQPQPVQAHAHVMPGGQHEPQPLRGPHDQQLKLAPRLVGVELMRVADHQPQLV